MHFEIEYYEAQRYEVEWWPFAQVILHGRMKVRCKENLSFCSGSEHTVRPLLPSAGRFPNNRFGGDRMHFNSAKSQTWTMYLSEAGYRSRELMDTGNLWRLLYLPTNLRASFCLCHERCPANDGNG